MTGTQIPTHQGRATRVAVVGGSGFVGQAVLRSLQQRGIDAISVAAPRIDSVNASDWQAATEYHQDLIAQLASKTASCSVIVNAAGIADPGCRDTALLTAANGVLPGVIGAVAYRNNQRFIHISSAAVQGRAVALDQSEDTQPFSPYSESKALGERAALRSAPSSVVYRPPGVHSPDRSVTRSLARIARSRAASVARPGDANTAQALVENVADAVAFLAICPEQPPRVVSHPSEGLTTSALLRLLGGREPLGVPRPFAVAVIKISGALGKIAPPMAAMSRRLEMLWFGQPQSGSWLESVGWTPALGQEAWAVLGIQLREAGIAKGGTSQSVHEVRGQE